MGRGFGEPQPQPRPPLLSPDLQLRMPPFETLIGFRRDNATLSGVQLERVKRVADFISNTWRGTAAITSIRVTGYIDSNEWQSDLGQRRADGVRNALVDALEALRPGLATKLHWNTEDRGLSQVAKVEIYLWAGPTPPPVPPLVRIPSPAEVARRMVPTGPETVEERIQRILRTLPPAPPPRRTFNQAFWAKVDERVNATMSRLNIPMSLRGPIRDGIRAAIRRGSEALLDQILGATNLPGEVQKAIKGTAKAAAELPMP